MQAILECKNLTKKFGRKTALDDVSLQLKSGKIYGLLGENGSGKTTWMKLIAGLSKPEKGEIFYEGHPLCAKDKESIAYMATENFFYSYMKIKDVEKYYTDFFAGFDRAAFWNLIGKTGLDGEMKVRELSSGMNAKLRIAATLARKAKLTLLDGSKVHLGDSWIKIPCSDPADADRLCDVCGSRTDLYPGHITAYRTFE